MKRRAVRRSRPTKGMRLGTMPVARQKNEVRENGRSKGEKEADNRVKNSTYKRKLKRWKAERKR